MVANENDLGEKWDKCLTDMTVKIGNDCYLEAIAY